MQHIKIRVKNFEFQGESILKNIELTINKNDRISVVGPNGAGKTTFLRILCGEINDYDGFMENIGNINIGYLHQIYSDDEEKSVAKELEDAFGKLVAMEHELGELEKDMQDIEYYTTLLEQFQANGGYAYKNTIHQVANGMGILDLLDKKLVEISGGQRTKVALAKVLLEKPDLLVLDEPTNFIDMGSVEWLEGYLQNTWKGGYIIVSHDREFLDKTCRKTLEIQPARSATLYHCSYSDYLLEREKIEKIRMLDWERQQEYIEKQGALVNRFRAGSRAGWAKSREKMIDRMEKLEKPYIPQKAKFSFKYLGESPEILFTYKDAFIGREKDALFFIPEVKLSAKMRVGIIGENGVGKSTFLKTLLGKIPLLDGYISIGKSTSITYYSQLHEEIDPTKTVRENFQKHGLFISDEQLIGLLKQYLFEKEVIDKKVGELSGGQKSKIFFAIIGRKDANLLVLDEPTNHLDYDTREALEFALLNYPGSILFISHDRYFTNKIASHIWFIQDGELSISYGNYEDYRFKIEHKLSMDMHLFDEEAQLNLVLEEKLGEKEFKRLKNKFTKRKKR